MSINLNNRKTEFENIFDQIQDKQNKIEVLIILIMKQLNLSNTNLTSLPKNLSSFKNLISLDISNNPIIDVKIIKIYMKFQFEKIGKSLSTLPKLKELRIDLPTIENVKTILSNLPNLQILNDKSIQPNLFNQSINNLLCDIDLDENQVNEANLEMEIPQYNVNLFFNIFYQKILEAIITLSSNKNEVNEEFKNFLKIQMDFVDNLIEKNYPNYLYASQIIKIKIDIYHFLQNQILVLLSSFNESENPESNDIINGLLQLTNEVNYIIKEKENDIVSLVEMLYDKIRNINDKFVYKNENLIKENNKLKEEIDEKTKVNTLLEKNNKQLEKQIEINEEEKKPKTTLLLNNADEILNMDLNNNNNFANTNYLNVNNKYTTFKSIKKPNKKSQTFQQKNYKNIYSSNNNYNNINNNTYKPKNNSKSNSIVIVRPHNLTKEQLLQLIDEIYRSKSISNQKCEEVGKPIETMEQHLYVFLNQKFGLKSLTIEYASAIIKGIKDYSNSNSEICLFGMILRNELEENTINILNQIKIVMNDTLQYFLSEKYPSKNAGEINDLVNECKKGFVDEDIWNKIIECFFLKDNNAFENVKNKIYNYIERVLKKSNDFMSKKPDFDMTREEKGFVEEMRNYPRKITFYDLLNILLDYHIRTRSKYLTNFKIYFKKFDNNNDGILTKKELILFIRELNLFDESVVNENIDLLLRKLPNCEKYNSFSFSEVLALFDKEKIINEKGEEISLLDAIAK